MPEPTADLLDLPASDLASALRAARVSVTDHTTAVLARIAERDPRVHAFATLATDAALADSARLDAVPDPDRAALPLFGVPVAIKDEIDVAGTVTTNGGRAFTTPARADAEVITRLRRAGAVIVGKTHLCEFGQSPFTEGSWGATLNPYDLGRSPGGSSGGSAVAVATGMVPVAIGSDAGGSIRIPGAWTGVFGFKTSHGRVPTAPLPGVWDALGAYGPFTRAAADLALVTGVIADERPPTEPVDPSRLRVGWSVQPPLRGRHPDTDAALAVARAAKALLDAGHEVTVKPVPRDGNPLAFQILAMHGIAVAAEAADRPADLEARTRQAVALAKMLPRNAVPWARDAAAKLAFRAGLIFRRLDVLLTPVTPMLPPPLTRVSHLPAPIAEARSLRAISYTWYWNLAGNPAATVPLGLTREGLPLAVQVIGRHDREDAVIAAAAALERRFGPAAPVWPPRT